MDFIISADILRRNVFNNTSTFLYTVLFNYVQYIPEDNQGRSKHVGVMTDYVQNVILTFIGFICGLIMSCGLASCTDRRTGSYPLSPPLINGKVKLTYV